MVNVIIPTYKARDTLPKALNSLLAQTKDMFIVTISQDGDGEDYTDIIKEYDRRGLHIRHINSLDNCGPGIARQKGVDSDIMCDYVMFLDADDLLMPNAIETLYSEAKRNRLDVLSSNFIAEQKNSPNISMETGRIPITWTHGKIYRIQYLKENDIRFIDCLRVNEDAYFNLVAVNCTENKKRINEYTYLWRDNKSSITRRESHTEFFKKTWIDYIYGQILGLNKIGEVTKDLSVTLCAATLKNLYEYIECAKYLKCDIELVNSYLKLLQNNIYVQKALDDDVFWKYISTNLKASQFFEEDKLIFYKQPFSYWIRDNIQNEDLHN